MEKAFCCAPDFPVVQTNYGPVRGYRFREISSFKGIPYGRSSKSRFKESKYKLDCVEY